MNFIDSPLEALAYNTVNLGPLLTVLVNNFWAWLAVVTAALSFWRLRTTSSVILAPQKTAPETTLSSSASCTSLYPTRAITKKSRRASIDNEEDNANEEKEEEGVLTRGNSKKFFTVYYQEEEMKNEDIVEGEDDDCFVYKEAQRPIQMGNEDSNLGLDVPNTLDNGDDDVQNEGVVMIKRWGSSKELMVEMRVGDLGWYSYQDRRVIDGSVVRLWEEEKEVSSSPHGCRSKRKCSYFVAPLVL